MRGLTESPRGLQGLCRDDRNIWIGNADLRKSLADNFGLTQIMQGTS